MQVERKRVQKRKVRGARETMACHEEGEKKSVKVEKSLPQKKRKIEEREEGQKDLKEDEKKNDKNRGERGFSEGSQCRKRKEVRRIEMGYERRVGGKQKEYEKEEKVPRGNAKKTEKGKKQEEYVGEYEKGKERVTKRV